MENFPYKPSQWQKGQSGNYNGHPKGKKNRSTIAKQVLAMKTMLPDAILKELQDRYPEIKNGMSTEEIMSIIQANKAIVEADTHAYNSLLDSAYGKATQLIENENTNIDNDKEVTITIIHSSLENELNEQNEENEKLT